MAMVCPIAYYEEWLGVALGHVNYINGNVMYIWQ